MPNLSVRTRGNSSPQGKPRVYFSCCPEDPEVYFEPLCADIFASQDCAIYYNADPDTPADETQLADMQLFVVPVTTKYLFRSCRAREAEYGFAMAHHIPVLPIAVESGISAEFAEVMNRVGAGFGDVQLLKKVSRDPTEIPYAEKLRKLLGSILVGDELAERVRAAFDAYIFLSYRKKDRAYAKELMRLIHKIPYCRDIAIWYDEFLVPGEAWNRAIADAMAKSRLVTLAVTPSVIEPDNFIVQHEYPDAVASGKEVIPAELVPTDRDALVRLFAGIAPPVDGRDLQSMTEALQSIAVRENDDSPEHNFLIGLAYLSAIDVERDPERAAGLITSAAEADLPEAIEKLVSMYNTGEGVERDYLTAVQWQERLAAVLEKTKKDPLADRDMIIALWNAGEMWVALGRMKEAVRCFEHMAAYAEKREARYHSASTRLDLCAGYEGLGRVCLLEGDLAGAKTYYLKHLRLSETLAEERYGLQPRASLSISYDRLGGICEAEGDLTGAKLYYLKGAQLSAALAEETDDPELRSDMSVGYNKLGGICLAEGDLAGAKEYYLKGLRLSAALEEELHTAESRRDLSVSYDRLGDICRAEGDLAGAEKYYLQSLALRQASAEQTHTVEARRNLSASYNNLGDIRNAEGDLAGAKEYHLKFLRLSRALEEETHTVQSRHDLAVGYERLGDTCKAEGDLEGAEEYYLKSLALREVLAKQTKTAESRRDLAGSYEQLGGISEAEGDLVGAREYYLKFLQLARALEEETHTVQSRRDLALGYDRIGRVREEEGDPAGAEKYYLRALPLRELSAAETHTVEARSNLAVSCEELGRVREVQGDLAGAKAYYLKSLPLCEALEAETHTVHSRRCLYVIYDRLGGICQAEGDPAGAKAYYLISRKMREEQVQETGTPQAYEDLAIACLRLAGLGIGVRPMLQKAYGIYCRLAEECPLVARFAQGRDIVAGILNAL